jgi:hypothetical protein
VISGWTGLYIGMGLAFMWMGSWEAASFWWALAVANEIVDRTF